MLTNALILLVFALTYVLIAKPGLRLLPLGRPAAALCGAFLMVALGALSPAKALAAINLDTLLLLFAMMLQTAYLERAGFFDFTARFLLRRARTPLALLVWLCLVSGMLAALLVNDTVCVFLTPVVVSLCAATRLPYAPFLIALATSANIGSAATLVGNPQNMLIAGVSQLPFLDYFLLSAPAAALGLIANTLLLWLVYRKKLGGALIAANHQTAKPLGKIPLIGLLLSLIAFLMGVHLGFAALGGAVFMILATRSDPRPMLARVDYSLLVFFAGLFVVVAGLAETGLVASAFTLASPWLNTNTSLGLLNVSAFMTIGSNLISNVPLVLVVLPYTATLGEPTFVYVLLGFVTTIAGNLTLVGSVANLIVAEGAREHYRLGFREYLRIGLPSTLLTLTLGVAVIAWRMM